MADSKITALTSIGASTDPANDPLVLVDVSDTSMAASGTTKKVTLNQLLGASGTATLASATITGDLTVDTNVLKVDTTNNRVGVNIASPMAELHVIGGANFSDGTTTLRAVSSSNVSFLGTTTTDPLVLRVNNIEQYRIAQLGVFSWSDGAGGTRMTLNSTGLGVGASPTAPLHIFSSATGTGPITNVVGTFRVGAAGRDASLQFSDTVNQAYVTMLSGALLFGTGGANERLRIDSTGNVGVGVTPSAWGGYKAIGLSNQGCNLYALNASSTSGLTSNAYNNGTNWIYINSQASGRYEMVGAAHSWYTSASGTAGNAITFTQAMTLDASGNLLVGKTAVNDFSIGFQATQTGSVVSTLAASTNGTGSTMSVYSTGASAYRFYVGMGGTVFATNTTISAISDARLKENVQDIDVGLGAILALKPRKFDWKDGKGKDIKGDRGFIAQEFEQVFPQLVDEWKDNTPEGEAPYKSVRQDLIPVLVKAIQELAAEVNALKNA